MLVSQCRYIIITLLLIVNIFVDSYENEQIISAKHMTHSFTNYLLDNNIEHYGVYVTTEHGHQYLIHSMPNTSIVVTATKISNKWKIKETLTVNEHKTITSGTCIGAVKNIKKYLKS